MARWVLKFPETFLFSDWELTCSTAATLQYFHTAMIILLLGEPTLQPQTALQNIRRVIPFTNELANHANQVCSLALSSDCAAVWINSFGPIAFCKFCVQNLSIYKFGKS